MTIIVTEFKEWTSNSVPETKPKSDIHSVLKH